MLSRVPSFVILLGAGRCSGVFVLLVFLLKKESLSKNDSRAVSNGCWAGGWGFGRYLSEWFTGQYDHRILLLHIRSHHLHCLS